MTTMDHALRYAPTRVIIARGNSASWFHVTHYKAYPPNAHPSASPIVRTLTALECVTEGGSAWWGFEKAWINSELRMVVSGFSARDEARSRWEVCKCSEWVHEVTPDKP